jgi:hypothetical protein
VDHSPLIVAAVHHGVGAGVGAFDGGPGETGCVFTDGPVLVSAGFGGVSMELFQAINRAARAAKATSQNTRDCLAFEWPTPPLGIVHGSRADGGDNNDRELMFPPGGTAAASDD